MLRAREISARELLDAHLDRIDRLNPAVNAVVTLDADGARAAADAADAALAAGEDVGPLHGLPVAHKDTHATGGMRTTWGSPLHADTVPLRDELVVARLQGGRGDPGRQDERAGVRGRLAHVQPALRRDPQPLPARAVGRRLLRRRRGGAGRRLRAARRGQRHGRLAAQPGRVLQRRRAAPHARPGADVAGADGLVAAVGAGADGPHGRRRRAAAVGARRARPPGADLARRRPGAGFAAPLPERLDGLRVAWAPDLGGQVTVDPAITVGAGVVGRGCSSRSAPRWRRPAPTSPAPTRCSARCAPGCSRRRSARSRGARPEKVKESIRWNAEMGAKLTGPDLARAEQLHTRLYERMVAFFERYDVLLAPTTQVLPFPVEIEYPTEIAGVHQDNYLEWMRSCTVISATGCPALSVPGGFTADGLPVGLQVIGAPRADRRVLEVGHAFEQATRFGERRPAL